MVIAWQMVSSGDRLGPGLLGVKPLGRRQGVAAGEVT
jgi:hypothetical protein